MNDYTKENWQEDYNQVIEAIAHDHTRTPDDQDRANAKAILDNLLDHSEYRHE